VNTRRAFPACVAVLAALAAGCGGDDEGGGDGGGSGASGETLTVWNNEFQPDRMAATQEILDDFTAETGIKTKQVADMLKALNLGGRVRFTHLLLIPASFIVVSLNPPLVLFLGFLVYALSGPALWSLRTFQLEPPS
jgi:hypothetical protein